MPIRFPCGARSRDRGQQLAHERAGVERRGGVRLVAVDRLDQGGAQRRDALLPAHHVEEPRQRRVRARTRARRGRRGAARRRRAGPASRREAPARARRAGGSGSRAPRPGRPSAIESSHAGGGYSGHSITDLSPNGPGARRGFVGSGANEPSTPTRYSRRSTSGRAKSRRQAPSRHSKRGPGRGRTISCPSTTSRCDARGRGWRARPPSSRTRGAISASWVSCGSGVRGS